MSDEEKDLETPETPPPTSEEEEIVALLAGLGAQQQMQTISQLRAISIYGEITEETCYEALNAILDMENTGRVISEDPDNEDQLIETYEPFDMYISTWGGSAVDMFAVYDLMRTKREHCQINTIGMGKVMSAGILLLAAGTKGHRKVGRNCRLMIHGVISGQQGNLHSIENEVGEARWTQKQFVKALSQETNLTQKDIKKMIDKKLNVYFDAEEAVKMGIADEII